MGLVRKTTIEIPVGDTWTLRISKSTSATLALLWMTNTEPSYTTTLSEADALTLARFLTE